MISSLTFAYPDVVGASRAELAQQRREEVRPDQTFVLGTCLRLEIVVAGGVDRLADVVGDLLGDPAALRNGRVREGAAAAEHLFRVASGLESPFVGEREVLGQFRSALQAAQCAGSVSGPFARLLQDAVAAGRKARQHLPASPHASLAGAAARATLGAQRVAVLGSGAMSTAVVRALRQLPAPPAVTVVARSPEKVRLDDVDIWPIARLQEALVEFPAVITATSASGHLLDADDLRVVLARRVEGGVVVDMAMPPDFRRDDVRSMTYVDIDDLADAATAPVGVDAAAALVQRLSAASFRRYREHRVVDPLIAAIIARAEAVVDETTQRFASRLAVAGDDEAETAAMARQVAHTVARTLLADPLKFMRTAAEPVEAAQMLASAFGVLGDADEVDAAGGSGHGAVADDRRSA